MEEEFEKKSEKSLITSRLKDQIRKDLEIDEFALVEQCRDSPNVVQKYLEIFYSRKRILVTLRLDAEKMYAEYFDKYKHGAPGYPKRLNATEIKSIIHKHDDYTSLLFEIKKVEELVGFLEDTIRNLRDRFYMIKNIIEIRKMDQV